jgi:hypothetical protein
MGVSTRESVGFGKKLYAGTYCPFYTLRARYIVVYVPVYCCVRLNLEVAVLVVGGEGWYIILYALY